MRPAVACLIAALWLAPGAALAGGEGGSSPFGGQKKSSAKKEPGFAMASIFFSNFLNSRGNLFESGYKAVEAYNLDKETDSNYENFWRLRTRVDSSKKAPSPKAAVNQAPVRDPDDLPGLDY